MITEAIVRQRERLFVVSFGAGIDSTAMLLHLAALNLRPDLILFADTGDEKPETYEHMLRMNAWCYRVGFPPIQIVRRIPPIAPYRTLEQQCLHNEALPSLAFGPKTCSHKWKIEPQEKFIKQWLKAQNRSNEKIINAVGFDDSRSDQKRACKPTYANGGNSNLADFWFPLQEWHFDRDACVAIIHDAGLDLPPKSCCFYCPAHKPEEILTLSATHPDLVERALIIERNFLIGKHEARSTKGLGRRFTWHEVLGRSLPKRDLPIIPNL